MLSCTTVWRSPHPVTTSTVERAEADELYLQSPLDVLDKYGLKVWATSTVRRALVLQPVRPVIRR
jgi:hypothetical protein